MKKPFYIFLFLLFGCSCDNDLFFNTVEITNDFSHIENPEERWAAYNLKDYVIVQSRSCECLPPYEAQVYILKDEVEHVEICFNGSKSKQLDEVPYCDEKSRKRAFNFTRTVNEAFQLISQYEDSAHFVDITYHPRFGFPTRIYIDIQAEVADEEIHLTFSDLKRIER